MNEPPERLIRIGYGVVQVLLPEKDMEEAWAILRRLVDCFIEAQEVQQAMKKK